MSRHRVDTEDVSSPIGKPGTRVECVDRCHRAGRAGQSLRGSRRFATIEATMGRVGPLRLYRAVKSA